MEVLQKRARFIVLCTLVLMTVVIFPAFNDSFNVPKLTILFFATALSPMVLANPNFGFLNLESWKIWAPLMIYLIAALILALLSDQKNALIYGSYGRNMGWSQLLGFVILFLLSAYSFNFKTLLKLFDLLLILGLLMSFYGFLQYKGIDFLNYKDTGLPIITTLGNSNFASAFIGLSSILLIWKIATLKSFWVKIGLAVLLLANLQVIQLSKSSQGLFIFALGASIFIGIRFFSFRKNVGLAYFSFLGVGLFLAFLGLLRIGPLRSFLYQDSTSYRGDYYRAAWRMFQSDPFSGVGFDAFGIYYRSFRDSVAALRLGPQVTVDYAHNNLLQLLATGGVVLALPYLASVLVVAIGIRKGFKKFSGNDKYLFGALVSVWFGYLLQEQVSVSQLTLTSIGWVLSGAIVALGYNFDLIKSASVKQNIFAKKSKTSSFEFISFVLTCIFLIVTTLILSPKWKAEESIYSAKKLSVSFSNLQGIGLKEDFALTAVALQPSELQYRFLAADVFLQTGNMEAARLQLKEVLELNPRSDPAMVYLASLYEYSEEWNEAIKLRIAVSQLDPLNTINWLQLGKDLAKISDYQAVNKIIQLVAPLADKSTIVNDLKALLPADPTS